MNKIILSTLFFAICNLVTAQNLKTLADSEINDENYPKAISYLEQAIASNPNDAEAWYLLGHCLHWLHYDSVPLIGDERHTSDRVLDCMQKALALDPHLRNCYAVIGSEYGGRAVKELRAGNLAGFMTELRLGKKAGGYPEWLLEYARNTLHSCNPDAILIAGGDADIFPVWYCQFIEHIRPDVTLIPVTLLDRPWFILILKSGLDDFIRPVGMTWTREQIMEMHPAKWTSRSIDFSVPSEAQRRFDTNDSSFQWILTPDLQRNDRTFLSINKIILLGLLTANNWHRPVHFTLGCPQWILSDLDDHLQLHCTTTELVPFSIKAKGKKINIEATTRFLTDTNNFRRLATLKEQNIPSISPVLANYRAVYWQTCDSLLHSGDFKSARLVFDMMETNVPTSLLPMPDSWKNEIDNLRERIKVSKY
ncbi:MAG: tetratricopeptide repeat protein [Bacteroidota bacterium]